MSKRKYSQDFSGDSVVQQHFKESTDINAIIRQHQMTGIDPYEHRKNPQFGYATSQTYYDACRNTAEIQSAFMELPSKERASHLNDPGRWLLSMQTPPQDPDEIVAPAASEEPSATAVPPEAAPDA